MAFSNLQNTVNSVALDEAIQGTGALLSHLLNIKSTGAFHTAGSTDALGNFAKHAEIFTTALNAQGAIFQPMVQAVYNFGKEVNTGLEPINDPQSALRVEECVAGAIAASKAIIFANSEIFTAKKSVDELKAKLAGHRYSCIREDYYEAICASGRNTTTTNIFDTFETKPDERESGGRIDRDPPYSFWDARRPSTGSHVTVDSLSRLSHNHRIGKGWMFPGPGSRSHIGNETEVRGPKDEFLEELVAAGDKPYRRSDSYAKSAPQSVSSQRLQTTDKLDDQPKARRAPKGKAHRKHDRNKKVMGWDATTTNCDDMPKRGKKAIKRGIEKEDHWVFA
ncbi:hypothetical protein BX600DRAFT_436993 [Xylariales sp. PMI_506]|nr:hypothetical protein BX600DRAFT_436993 [Xylariales sp. PMI_506]